MSELEEKVKSLQSNLKLCNEILINSQNQLVELDTEGHKFYEKYFCKLCPDLSVIKTQLRESGEMSDLNQQLQSLSMCLGLCNNHIKETKELKETIQQSIISTKLKLNPNLVLIEDIRIKLQNAMSIINPSERIKALESCLELCDLQLRLLELEEYSILDLYDRHQRKTSLEKFKQTIEDCIIDAKLKPLW